MTIKHLKGPDKFRHALNILINEVNSKQFSFIESNGIAGFRDLNHRQHFPGLGQVKKLSIMHHIETFNDFLKVLEENYLYNFLYIFMPNK